MSPDHLRSPNRLLAALPEIEYQRLEPYLTSVFVSKGTIFYEASEKIETVYFPDTALISLVSILANGTTTEVGLIGGTGMIGLPVILSNSYTNHRAIVQAADSCQKISAVVLKREFDRGGELQRLLLNYAQSRLNEATQLAVCNAHHTIQQRLARWLLTVQDLVQSDKLAVTQEFISNMLGVRRSGVTVAASIFQQAGLIKYSRGEITVLNRKALEDKACECYQLLYHNYYRH